jgi:hypothetical protein
MNLGDHSDSAVTSSAGDFAAAYQRLVAELEAALWYDDGGRVDAAYQELTDAYSRALADPQVSERLNGALQRLTDALGQALDREAARSAVEQAAAQYLREIGEAWPHLRAREGDAEALVAVATGMTTLAWLFGLGAAGLVAPFASTDLFATNGGGGSWTTAVGGSPGDGWGAPPGERAAAADSPTPAPAQDGDDDGIVWQEFAVGDDGEIVERPAAPEGGAGLGRPESDGPSGQSADREARVPGDAARPADPVEMVERAYGAYIQGLQASGAPVGAPAAGDAGAASSAAAAPAAPSPLDLEQRTGELTAAYLRWVQGVGSLPELSGAYARLLGSANALIQQQVTLVQGYERLIALAMLGRSPVQMRQAVDGHYRSFLAAVREAWAGVDPADLSAERLSAMTARTAQAAALHETATGVAGLPTLG